MGFGATTRFVAGRVAIAFALALALFALGALAPVDQPAGAARGADARRTAAAATRCRGQNLIPTGHNVSKVRRATLCLVNRARRRHGLRPLRPNRKLRRAAQRHSMNMVREQFFAHVDPEGRTEVDRIIAAGFAKPNQPWALGENIAWGTGRLATPANIVRAWMASPGHRANILRRDYKRIGIGIAPNAPLRTAASRSATYTTDFGAILG